jgi:N-acetylneuraminic acid mutarotase
MKNLLLLSFFLLGIIIDTSAAGQWSQKADFGSFGRHRGVAVGIGNKVYAGTGHLNGDGSDEWFSEWWEYDPATNSWAQKADYIGNNGNGDQDLTAIAIDGIGYMSGGWLGGAGHFKYNPITNTWTQIALPPASFANTDPFVIDGKGYYMSWGSSTFYMFDPVLDTWTLIGSMPASVNQRSATFVIDGKGYFKSQFSFFEFQPVGNIWTQKANFPGTAPNNNIGLSQHGYGFYIGGYLGWGDMYQEVWRYDPAVDTWAQMEDYPFTARRWTVKAKVGEKCYMGLGTNGTNFSDFWEFSQFADLNEFEIEDFQAYPTLADDHVNFVSENINDFEILVFSTLGEKVSSISAVNGTARLEKNNISSGTYIYHVVRNGEILHSERFVFR